jgi:hypothetical protein
MRKTRTLFAADTLLGEMITIPVTVASPASAATLGSGCSIYATLALNTFYVPGAVSSDGNSCVPNPRVTGALPALKAGLPCTFDGFSQLLERAPQHRCRMARPAGAGER